MNKYVSKHLKVSRRSGVSLYIHFQIAKFMCTHLETHFLIKGMHECLKEIK